MLDTLITEFDRALRTLYAQPRALRPSPASTHPDAPLTDEEKRHAAGLMRINHTGEVCAQALYQGQALTARDHRTRDTLRQAAFEETEHLAWTAERLTELGAQTSLLNPIWYGGSLAMGLAAGLLGDKWNLGFLAETERQVEAHLDAHLNSAEKQLPLADAKSRAIVAQMKVDEAAHADTATALGAANLPPPVRKAMRCTSRLMKALTYRL